MVKGVQLVWAVERHDRYSILVGDCYKVVVRHDVMGVQLVQIDRGLLETERISRIRDIFYGQLIIIVIKEKLQAFLQSMWGTEAGPHPRSIDTAA